jgi:hypothetical protein
MKDGNQPEQGSRGMKPAQQTSENNGSIKGAQRGPDDFRGKSDTPRGSEPQIRGSSGRRG